MLRGDFNDKMLYLGIWTLFLLLLQNVSATFLLSMAASVWQMLWCLPRCSRLAVGWNEMTSRGFRHGWFDFAADLVEGVRALSLGWSDCESPRLSHVHHCLGRQTWLSELDWTEPHSGDFQLVEHDLQIGTNNECLHHRPETPQIGEY